MTVQVFIAAYFVIVVMHHFAV